MTIPQVPASGKKLFGGRRKPRKVAVEQPLTEDVDKTVQNPIIEPVPDEAPPPPAASPTITEDTSGWGAPRRRG